MNVWYSTNENAWLSNLADRPFNLGGLWFFSVEHAYQSLKSGRFDPDTYYKYKGPGQKIKGKTVRTQDNYNLLLMKLLIRESFLQNDHLIHILISTRNHVITHNQANPYWREHFPKILMNVRNEFDFKAHINELIFDDDIPF